ncbi:hypothetical protein QG040_10050, partial [Kingella kingae]|nr:hypothetical protein [Kingella kingae]
MSSTVQQALALLEKLTGGATIIDNGVGICKNPNDAGTAISNGAQITAVASALISKNHPAVTIAVAPATAITTTYKILDDISKGKRVSSGDILTVTGNVISLIGVTGLLAGSSPAVIAATALGITLGALGIGSNNDWFQNIDLNAPLCEEGARDYNNLNRDGKAHGYDPLILNLDGKGIQTLAPSSVSARFDHNADGIATATGWTAAGNGILALDLDKNGKIDSGKEIFGNHSVLSNGATAAHGYAALAELDSNHDNLINQADE